MKRCPECRRDYYDDSLLYCLDDGSLLLEGPAVSPDQQATLVIERRSLYSDMAGSRLDLAVRTNADVANAVAVLPFANLSRAEDSEYLSDGLAEELISILSKIKGIRVVARTSAFAFKGQKVGVAEIGRILHAQFIVEGSVRMSGDRVRVAVQLVNTTDGYHRWSETYDRRLTDLFAIQDDIAQSVVNELRETLIGARDAAGQENVSDELANAIRGRANDPEAYRLMLLGRHLLDRSNENDAVKAVAYLKESLELDPSNASCWVLLGRAYFEASNLGWHSLDSDYREAEVALQRAVALEPDLAEGLARLGRILWYRDGDYRGAEKYLSRALAIAPDDVVVLISASSMLKDLGRFREALEHCGRATVLDPVGVLAWQATAYASFLGGDLARAEIAARRTLELAPQRVFGHALLGLILQLQGHDQEGLDEASKEPDDFWRSWALSMLHYRAGRKAESDHELAKLIDEAGHDSQFQIAEVHAARGEIEDSFEWLARAVESGDPGKVGMKVSPFLKTLHSDSRWIPLLRKVGFPSIEDDI